MDDLGRVAGHSASPRSCRRWPTTVADQESFARQVRELLAHLGLAEQLVEPPDDSDQDDQDEDSEQPPAGGDENADGEGEGEEQQQSAAQAERDSGGEDQSEVEAMASDSCGAERRPAGRRGRRRPRSRAPTGRSSCRRAARSLAYKVFATQFDEVVTVEELCGPSELTRLRAQLDQSLIRFQGMIGRMANRLQRKLMAQQQRSWSFDLDEGILDTARLSRVVVNPATSLSFKMEDETEFRDTVVVAADRQFRLDARPADRGRRDERRHPGPHARALRRQGRDPGLHHPGLEGRPVARGLAARRQARPIPAGSTTCATSSTSPPTRPGAARAARSA